MASWLHTWISLIFILFALVQLNDEDYFIWVPIYLLPAILNTAFIFYDPCISDSKFGLISKILMFVHSQVCIIMSIYLVWNKNWFDAETHRGKRVTELMDLLTDPVFEVERELGGLWICLFWIHRFWPTTRVKSQRPRSQFSKKKIT